MNAKSITGDRLPAIPSRQAFAVDALLRAFGALVVLPLAAAVGRFPFLLGRR